jgi:prepilin-type N-terminal cleavage/methylation domain-containing protein/prepilin-type processing-associated H-X9-DG protein
MRHACGRHGFTLIELLVVVAVIALLAAMLLPVIAQVREKARQASCLSNLQQLVKAQLLYVQDWDDQFPHWWQYEPHPGEPGASFTYWTMYFQPYLRSQAILTDASFRWEPQAPDPWTNLPAPNPGTKLADYALFTWGPSGDGTADNPYWRWAGPPLTLAQVSRPSETFNLMDGLTTTTMTEGLVRRHHEGVNAAFLDGHARWISLTRAFEVTRDAQGEYYYRYIAADRG